MLYRLTPLAALLFAAYASAPHPQTAPPASLSLIHI